MKKTYTLLLLIFLISSSSFAQSQEELYLQKENSRIASANATELAIDNFTTNNLSSYSLTQARLSQVTNPSTEGGTQTLTGQALEDAILVAKKEELRKLYFQQNPSSLDNYTANSFTQQINCVNGNFETGTTASYTFRTRQEWNHTECNTLISSFNALTPSTTLNNYGAFASLVTPGTDTFLDTKGININKVPVNGGSFALRINKSQDNSTEEETVLSRTFTADQSTFSLNYALAFENPSHPGNTLYGYNPFVRFRITDTTNGVFVERCISSTDNTGLLLNGFSNWKYMDWTCLDLNINQFVGHSVILQIVIADCSLAAHDAILYLDHICNYGSPCSGNTVGSLLLNPFNINCPISPFNICGSFTTPSLATGNPNLTLQIIPIIGTPITLNNAVITNNDYCFNVNPSLFGNSPQASYEINVNASFNNGTIQISSNNTNVSGADISFNNCITPTIILNPVGLNCPSFPMTVSGTFIAPTNNTINPVLTTLNIINSANTIVGTVSNPIISGNTFTFSVNQIDFFGTNSPTSGNFEFKVNATFVVNGGTAPTVLTDLDANSGPDVSFNNCPCCPNCCPDIYNIVTNVPTGFSDRAQAKFTINATNVIDGSSGYLTTGVYHAGNTVVLKPGFHAKIFCNFRAYIEGCSNVFQNRMALSPKIEKSFESIKEIINTKSQEEPISIDLTQNVNGGISIYPNPNKGVFKILLNDVINGYIDISDFNGTIVYKKTFKNQSEFEINIQDRPKGIYVIKVISGEQVITKKIIKN